MSAPGYLAPSQTPRDPTAVMGTRVLAWVVDFLIYVALLAALFPPFSPLAEKAPLPEGGMSWERACNEVLADTEDAAVCLIDGDNAYWTDADDALIQYPVILAWFVLVYVIWQGVSGLTPGKALAGLRVVREDGRPPGIGKALVRSLLWVVDGIPGFPLVGFITAVSSTGHRRVGDMAAKTFVVSKSDAGRPIQVPGLTPTYAAPPPGMGAGVGVGTAGYASPGQGVPTWGGAPTGSGPGTSWPTSPPTAPAEPPTAPTAPASGGTPSWGTPETTATWGTTPSWGGTPPSDTPAGATPAATGSTPSASPASSGGGPSQDPTQVSPAADTGLAGPPSESPAGAPAGAGSPSPQAAAQIGTTPGATGQGPGSGEGPAATSGESETTVTSEVGPPSSAEQPPTAPMSGPSGGETPASGSEPPTAGTAGTGGATSPGAASGSQTYAPQWDAARRAYIQWDPNRGRWLQWDDTAKEWKVL